MTFNVKDPVTFSSATDELVKLNSPLEDNPTNLQSFLRSGHVLDFVFVIALLSFGLITRFWWISWPPDVVWDEVHFARFDEGYLQGRFYFDAQPPLGHLILWSALKMAHANPGDYPFEGGIAYPPHYPYIAARALPALAGSLFPAIIYFLARALTFGRAACFFTGCLVVLDNAILAESHFALIDIFVPFFGFLALLVFVLHRRQKPFSTTWWCLLAAAGVVGGLAVSVKWTGLGAVAVMLLAIFFEQGRYISRFKIFFLRAFVICAMASLIYFSVFAIHFRLLPKEPLYMSIRIENKTNPEPGAPGLALVHLNFWQKFVLLNKSILTTQEGFGRSHPYRSSFYEWPVGRKPIPFWGLPPDRMIWLIPNPIVWLFGFATMTGGILYSIAWSSELAKLKLFHQGQEKLFALKLLLCTYLINWLPFAAIKREMFLYHYFSALIASLLFGSLIVFEIRPMLGGPFTKWLAGILYGTVLLAAVLDFIVLAPVSYGFHQRRYPVIVQVLNPGTSAPRPTATDILDR